MGNFGKKLLGAGALGAAAGAAVYYFIKKNQIPSQINSLLFEQLYLSF